MESVISICFVDDEPTLNETYTTVLVDHYLVRTFLSAEKAIEAIKKGYRPQVIVTDLNMPKICGFQFLKFLDEMGIFVPVIAISGIINPTVLEKLIAHHVYNYLEKPFCFDELKNQIESARRRVVARAAA